MSSVKHRLQLCISLMRSFFIGHVDMHLAVEIWEFLASSAQDLKNAAALLPGTA